MIVVTPEVVLEAFCLFLAGVAVGMLLGAFLIIKLEGGPWDD